MPATWRWLLLAALLPVAAVVPAQEATPDLDELQRRLDAMKAQEAREAEAARRAAAERAAQRARMATLVIRTDAPCTLRIDGAEQGHLAAETPRTLEVIGGKQLIECASTEETAVRTETIAEIPAGAKDIVTLQLTGKLNAIREERAAAARREAEALAQRQREAEAARQAELARQQAAQAAQTYLARWTDTGKGVLKDSQTGLEWAQRDNGKDVNWNQARRYCESLRLDGKGWRLPTVDELHSAYSPHGEYVKAGSYSVKASPLFRLTSSWFWSSTQNGSSSAFYVGLGNGSRYSVTVSGSSTLRALCVRRSS